MSRKNNVAGSGGSAADVESVRYRHDGTWHTEDGEILALRTDGEHAVVETPNYTVLTTLDDVHPGDRSLFV